MSGFPKQVNVVQALAVAGDFCDTNPRATVNAGPGGLVAGANGVQVGLFAWADASGLVSNAGVGAPTGFVHREQQGLITAFLAENTASPGPAVPAGIQTVLHSAGGFWAKNDGSVAATIGMKAYADNATGKISFNAAATPPAGGTSSASTIDAIVTTASSTLAANAFTASIAGQVMTVTAVVAGTVLGKGLVVAGTNVDLGTTILSQLTGTAGGTGTYSLSVSQNVGSESMTANGGGFTVSAMTTGEFYVGQVVSGAGITAGTKILAAGTGAGAAGTYVLDTAPTPGASITVTGAGGYMVIGGSVTGAFNVGDKVHYAGGATAANILLNASSAGALGLTGAGGAGTYIVSVGDTIGSEEIDVYSATETKWVAASAGAPGELVKMTTWLLG